MSVFTAEHDDCHSSPLPCVSSEVKLSGDRSALTVAMVRVDSVVCWWERGGVCSALFSATPVFDTRTGVETAVEARSRSFTFEALYDTYSMGWVRVWGSL